MFLYMTIETLVVFVGITAVCSYQEVRVGIPSLGVVVGSTTQSQWRNRTIYQFQGIPYAEPPSAYRRFKVFAHKLTKMGAKMGSPEVSPSVSSLERYYTSLIPSGTVSKPPEPVKPWSGELKATRFKKRCPQEWPSSKPDETTTDNYDEEDCLTLNIYSPYIMPDCSAGLLPTMFYIHGGSWRVGTATDFKPNYLVDKDVVLVVIQYRLGPLGFLSLQNEDMPGNAGLLDQVLALRWTKKYARSFCGDPDNITIFGSSAGAASVTLMIISPLVEEGLFHRAIFQSGSALGTWVMDPDPVRSTRDIAAYANCTSPDLRVLAMCLRRVSPQNLLDAHSSFLNNNLAEGGRATGGGGNHAVIQTAGSQRFLVEEPRVSLASGRYKRIPVMGGVTKHEGSFFLGNMWDYFILPQSLMNNSDYLTHNITRVALEFSGIEDKTGAISDIFREKYFKDEELGNFEMMTPGLIDICGVTLLKACTFRMVQENSRVAPSYLYSFNFYGRRTKFGYGYETNYPFPGGIAHSNDLIYLFPDGDLNHKEDRIARMMVDLWTSFAQKGAPSSELAPPWPAVKTEIGPYLRIDSEPEVRTNFLDEYTIAVKEGLTAKASTLQTSMVVVGVAALQKILRQFN